MILYHYPFCPKCRFVRLVLAELNLSFQLQEEKPWNLSDEVYGLDPAHQLPLLQHNSLVISGVWPIITYLMETTKFHELLPKAVETRIEVRRLMDWFLHKLDHEVTHKLVLEKIQKRFMLARQGGGPPDMKQVRSARAAMQFHLNYLRNLASQNPWLAGEFLTLADLAAGAHVSCIDYLGDVPWDRDKAALDWYQAISTRPSFLKLLDERVAGLAPVKYRIL